MSEIALVRDGVVVTVALADDPPDPRFLAAVAREYDEVVDVTGSYKPPVGSTYDGYTFTPPPSPQPDPEP